jgi:Ca-activated chloride channel family protein
MTALYDAVAEALTRLEKGSRGKKALIVISDGGDNASKRGLDGVLTIAQRSSALIYTVGIFGESDPDRNPGVLRRIARTAGGEAYFPNRYNSLAEVCERIARDIRHQYMLGYVSTNPARMGGYRTIRVAATNAGGAKLVVRARDGYLAAGDPRPVQQGVK